MKCAVISFTGNGAKLNRKLCRELSKGGDFVQGFSIEKYARETELLPLTIPLKEWTGNMFGKMDALIFLGACGIAVRSIAPFVRDKKTDPAVVVIDEQGKFAVSLLSGHLGGANELTLKAAKILGAQPVITTATDRQKKFAVDVFARNNQLYLAEMDLAKEVSSRIVNGETVGFYSEFPWDGNLPEELAVLDSDSILDSGAGKKSNLFIGTPACAGKEECTVTKNAGEWENVSCFPDVGICISLSEKKQPFPRTLHLIPRIVTAGIGCRKGVSGEAIRQSLEQALAQADISVHALCQAASIDLKAREPGILQVCRTYGIPFRTFSTGELQAAPGTFSGSDFVKNTTGVDNVCERSAVLAGGRLVRKKQAGGGVTIALAAGEWRAEF